VSSVLRPKAQRQAEAKRQSEAQRQTNAHLSWSPMTVADIDRLLDTEQQAYSHPWTRGNFIDSLAAGHWAWLATHDTEPMAYWVAQTVLDEVYLLNLTVKPAHWGQGMGRQLLAHVLQQARQTHASSVWLEVRPSNARALALYSTEGFVEVGRRRGYYPLSATEREDALLLRLNLGGVA
jgi:[ribosomal protein S18]-alanine N-acetyltransferase